MDKESGASKSLEEPNDSTLIDVVGSDSDRPGRIGRRIVLGIVALLILASPAGVFGLNPVVTISAPGYEHTVESPRSTRAGMDARITVDHDHLDAFTSYDVSPAPDGESSDGRVLAVEFDVPNENGFRVDIDGTSSEDLVVLSSGQIRVKVDDRLVGSPRLKTRKAFSVRLSPSSSCGSSPGPSAAPRWANSARSSCYCSSPWETSCSRTSPGRTTRSPEAC
jgi:hypothetical protein